MTTASSSFAVLQTTDTEFRAWIAGTIALLSSVGITQTTDTGQVNTGTVTRPAVANTVGGYSVHRFNDTLHSTKPLFFKLEYGTGAAVTNPAMWVTVGTGSDGAGNITGVLKARLQRTISAGTVAVEQRACYSTAVGVLWLMVAGSFATSNAFFVTIARTADADGTPNSVGVMTIFSASSVQDIEAVDFSTVTSRDVTMWHPLYAAVSTTDVVADNNGYPIATSALFPCFNKAQYTAGFMGCNFGAFIPGITVRARPYLDGSEHDYITMTGAGYLGGWEQGGDGDAKALLIWE